MRGWRGLTMTFPVAPVHAAPADYVPTAPETLIGRNAMGGNTLSNHEAELLDLIDQRDTAMAWADRLAYAVAPESAIGEHSSKNNPWRNALFLLSDLERVRGLQRAAVLTAIDGLIDDCDDNTSRFYSAALKVCRKRVREALDGTT